jgi:hypothetical protein
MEKHFDNIRALIDSINLKIGKPVSANVVTATIESFGIREKDLMFDFGFASIPDLADLVFYELNTDAKYLGSKNAKEKECETTQPKTIQVSDYLRIKTQIFAQYYSLGIFHLLPVLIQIIAIVLFGYSLWTFIGFNEIQSTAVVLGVIVGLIATAGFVQVIGRQASFYWNYEDYTMTNKIINYFHRIGVLSIFLVLTSIFFINFFFHMYPYEVLFVIFMYAFLIGSLVLLLAPFHTIKQRWVISVSIFVGTAISIYLKQNTTLLVYVTHWIGIVCVIFILKLFLKIYFHILTKKQTNLGNSEIILPVLLYHNFQYFFYGLFLYFFVFIDRILAWSTGINGKLPFLVYFDKNYELGMDFAILVYLLLAGVLEYSIASFTKFIDIGQKITNYDTPEIFNSKLKTMYWQQIALLFVTATAAFFLIYTIMFAPWGFTALFHEKLNWINIKVTFIGGLGYVLLAWGMLNSLYLFTLGQVTKPLFAIIYACLLNVAIGFFLSRFYSYECSVIGMLFGAALFVFLTLKANLKLFKNLDYYYYAAY